MWILQVATSLDKDFWSIPVIILTALKPTVVVSRTWIRSARCLGHPIAFLVSLEWAYSTEYSGCKTLIRTDNWADNTAANAFCIRGAWMQDISVCWQSAIVSSPHSAASAFMLRFRSHSTPEALRILHSAHQRVQLSCRRKSARFSVSYENCCYLLRRSILSSSSAGIYLHPP